MSKAFIVHRDHIRLAVRLTPSGGRNAIDGVETNAAGEIHLKVRVSAVPEKGKANKALIELLAKTLGTPKSSIQIISGDTSRQKILRIAGDPEDLSNRLDVLAGG
ncbi:DUF167 domain-containing protein [Rhizobium sp. RU36D]|uniref:DUF167 domain-containing protein n=1 Tax=Rhizobium sp. RU36D TaxID=1907415 RepID=UPI0009D7A052|nr:DUF167 domain-containing protein [Rhizobium sp. RU36D]SMC76908.1 hypothetical protein SAMN05880593_106120 [Rhizobium sp. RU36D]